jgi:prepilin-type N-terminal cleavage/methylation domain-containing protein
MDHLKNPKGFTLLEFMVALLIMVVGILSLGSLQVTAIKGNLGSRNLTTANILAERKIEEFKTTATSPTGFAGLVVMTNHADPSNPLNSDGLGGNGNTGRMFNRAWTIETYAGSANMKRIIVTVTWPEGGQTRSTSLDTVIANPI